MGRVAGGGGGLGGPGGAAVASAIAGAGFGGVVLIACSAFGCPGILGEPEWVAASRWWPGDGCGRGGPDGAAAASVMAGDGRGGSGGSGSDVVGRREVAPSMTVRG